MSWSLVRIVCATSFLFLSAASISSAFNSRQPSIQFKMQSVGGRQVVRACTTNTDKKEECVNVDSTRGRDGMQACFRFPNQQQQCQSMQATCQRVGDRAHDCQVALQVGKELFGEKKCPDGSETMHCTDGEATQSVRCGGSTVRLPYMTLGYQRPQGNTNQFQMVASCENNKINVRLNYGTEIAAEKRGCPVSELQDGNTAVFFWYDPNQLRTGAQLRDRSATLRPSSFRGTWHVACSKADKEQLQRQMNQPRQDLDPAKSKEAQSPEDLAKQARDNAGQPFHKNIDENRRVVAQCDAQGRCQYQTFEKDESGNWVPRSSPVQVEKDKLESELKKINSAEAFDRVSQQHPHPSQIPLTDPTKDKDKDKDKTGPDVRQPTQEQPYQPPHNNNASGFRPTSSSSNPQQRQPQQQPQQQYPQQYPQQQQNIPAPYCAGIKASKSEITEGEQVTIQWSIPYAIRFELKGGTGTINGSVATVRPRETTAYSVVGYGIPGAGQTQQYGGYGNYSPYGQQSYGQFDIGTSLDGGGYFGVGIGQQYGSSQQQYAQYSAPQQSNCGIPGAACCGPVTVTVQPKKVITRDVVVADTQEKDIEPEDDYASQKPEIRCSPKDMEVGKSATVVWSCPENTRRATSLAKHINGTPLTDTESFYVEGKAEGTQKVYPQSTTIYAVRCISAQGKRSETSSCSVRVVPRTAAPVRSAPAPTTSATPSANDMKLSISADPTKIKVSSQEVTISWRTANVDSCQVSGPNGFSQQTTQGSVTGSSDKVGPLTFTLSCQKGSQTKTRSVTVDVQ